MFKFLKVSLCITYLLLISNRINAEIIFVSSQQEFDEAQDNSAVDDSIVWRSGIYSDIFMDIDNDNLFIMAETLGSVVLLGLQE